MLIYQGSSIPKNSHNPLLTWALLQATTSLSIKSLQNWMTTSPEALTSLNF
ncbi:UNVERIFIED_CONTAM: hypothetical protein GTU68_065905 [Idotea baltica]|nr:hypothetical protein [Idotea baltica]